LIPISLIPKLDAPGDLTVNTRIVSSLRAIPILIALLSLSGCPGFRGSLVGIVLDATTESPVCGAIVELRSANRYEQAVSDSNGVFAFLLLPDGEHSVQVVSADGYAASDVLQVSVDSRSSEDAEPTIVEIQLSPGNSGVGEPCSDSRNVAGTVLDAESRAPVCGALVMLSDQTTGVSTGVLYRWGRWPLHLFRSWTRSVRFDGPGGRGVFGEWTATYYCCPGLGNRYGIRRVFPNSSSTVVNSFPLMQTTWSSLTAWALHIMNNSSPTLGSYHARDQITCHSRPQKVWVAASEPGKGPICQPNPFSGTPKNSVNDTTRMLSTERTS